MQPEQPGHHTQCNFLSGIPMNSKPAWVRLKKTSDLAIKARCHVRTCRRIERRFSRHSERVWKPAGFPNKFDFAGLFLQTQHLRRWPVRRPAFSADRIAMPIDRIVEVSDPPAEAQNPPSGRFPGFLCQASY